MEKTINVLRWICAIILAIGIIIFGITQTMSSTILSKEYVLKKLEQTDYYINTYSQVNSDFENYIYQSGLNKKIFENVVSKEDIKEDTNIIISNIYDGKEKQIDLDKVRERLKNNIQKIITEKNIWVKSQESIDKYVEIISVQYEDSILHTNIENNLFTGIVKLHDLANTAITISVSAIGITAVIILITRYKKFWQNMSIIGVSLVASGIFYIFMQAYIKFRVDIKNIIILSEAISYTLKTIIFEILHTITIFGVGMTVIGFVLILVGNIIRDKKHKQGKRK